MRLSLLKSVITKLIIFKVNTRLFPHTLFDKIGKNIVIQKNPFFMEFLKKYFWIQVNLVFQKVI